MNMDYAVDIVFCVDKSNNNIISQLADTIDIFCEGFYERMEEEDRNVDELRIKVIAYGDLLQSSFALSEFYVYNDNIQKSELFDFCHSIKCETLQETETVDALEALASALNSEWTNKGARRRHVIIMLNQHICSALGDHKASVYYPDDMPVDLLRLTDRWEGTEATSRNAYQPRAGRLMAIVPNADPWTKLQAWNRYWPAFINSTEGFADIKGLIQDLLIL